MSSFYIKTQRSFSTIRKYGWLVTLVIAVGGLWVPKLGLLVPLVMVSLMIMSLFKGKYWCGNYCFHGSLFDNLIMPVSRNKKTPGLLRSKTFILLFFLFFMFNLGRRFGVVYDYMGTAAFWDRLGFVFVMTYLVVTIVGGILNTIINPRAWCNFCPMGSIQSAFYRLGKYFRMTTHTDIKVTMSDASRCPSCGKCARVCPMQLHPQEELASKDQVDDEACIRCSTCVKNCPVNLLSLQVAKHDFPEKKRKIT